NPAWRAGRCRTTNLTRGSGPCRQRWFGKNRSLYRFAPYAWTGGPSHVELFQHPILLHRQIPRLSRGTGDDGVGTLGQEFQLLHRAGLVADAAVLAGEIAQAAQREDRLDAIHPLLAMP